MDFRAKLTALGLILALGVGLFTLRSVPWAYPFLLWILLSCLAAIWIEDQTHRPSLIAHLTAPTYTTLYTRLTARPASWPRDHRLYDWSLRLAVLYPVLLPLLGWVVTGQATSIGDLTEGGSGLVIFTAEPRLWPRGAVICAIVLALIAPKLEKWAAASSNPVLQRVSGSLPITAFAVAFAVAGAGAFAVAVAAAFEKMINRGRPRAAYIGLMLFLIAALAGGLALLDWAAVSSARRMVFLFIGILPLLNAIFDYISYLITLTLLRWGRRAPEFAVWAGVIDLIAALILFTLSGTAMIAAIAAAHALAGTQLFPLEPLFQGIHDTPAQYWWLYAMLFSTILPTVLHGIVALAAVPAAMPLHWRQRFADWAGQDGAVPAIAAPLAIGAVWTVCTAIALGIPTLLYVIASTLWPQLGGWYLGWFEGIARALGELPPL